MIVRESNLSGVLIVEPRVFADARGKFHEVWQDERYSSRGIGPKFVQDNTSQSSRGTTRGLHLQEPRGQGKLVQVLYGSVFDVAVDMRVGSPQFKKWTGVELSDENCTQLWIPAGFAHGFCVTSASAVLYYKCTNFYSPQDELTIRFDDPDINVDWPVKKPILSEKDLNGLSMASLDLEILPKFQA
jgi:dTDP-4-dehydrorhamnose 3,5-epimerase